MKKGPLEGLKVLDAATMLAGPWAGTHLADFGAEVVKVEHPTYGDHARNYGKKKGGESVYWKSLNRNKRTITLNIKESEGQQLLLEMLPEFDVMLENFRPGTLEKWGIGWDVLSKANPSLILLRTSGYGQSGPYSQNGGFGTVAEAMSGFTSVNGERRGKPLLPGIPLADGVSGAFGALGIMMAIYERDRDPERKGQYIDISLYEPLMRFLEPHLMAYDQLGSIPEKMGNGSVQTAPRNAYETKDGNWVALSGSTQSVAANVFKAIGQPELIEDARFETNEARLKNVQELDEIIGGWIAERNLDEVMKTFNQTGAVVGPMYTIDQMREDPHFIQRRTFVEVEDNFFGKMQMPNVFAHFSKTPGRINHSGQTKGSDNEAFYISEMKVSKERYEELKEKNII
ncbi:CaiB/BaiF CoA transferase family protein [Shouchella shacheensis]|uniref:CaiB/BaiF CoA transferase family protein n=1 Tax=Shouchella shacheensis TaxID=1649580 RepID=UPI00073FB759|nr:CoA transferase [Shouchella shacheensis]